MQVVDSEREKLQVLVTATDELIAKVGEATVASGCDVNLLGKLYAQRPYEAGGTNHNDYSSADNGYNLLDGNTGTYFHRWPKWSYPSFRIRRIRTRDIRS
jgi:hypothetical protein